jgi:RHS repeat-associated protein
MVYAVDGEDDLIRAIDPTTGVVSTVAGDGTEGDTGDGGAATSAEIAVRGIAAANGVLYIGQSNDGHIREVDLATAPSASTFLLSDAGGSVRAQFNDSGTLLGTVSYDAYGNPIAQPAGGVGTMTTPMGYSGAYTDPTTGLIYLQARWYDPTTAQFLSVDPLVAKTGQPYEYTGDNPVNNTDPGGMVCTTQECILGDAASVMSAASAITGFFFFIPGAEAISFATGVVALAADGYNCIVNNSCNWADMAMDVVALVPGGAALKASGDVKAIDKLIAGAVDGAESLDPALKDSQALTEFVGHVEGWIGGSFSAAGSILGGAETNGGGSVSSTPCGGANSR